MRRTIELMRRFEISLMHRMGPSDPRRLLRLPQWHDEPLPARAMRDDIKMACARKSMLHREPVGLEEKSELTLRLTEGLPVERAGNSPSRMLETMEEYIYGKPRDSGRMLLGVIVQIMQTNA